MATQGQKSNSAVKRLLGNKNTVTLGGIVLCVITLVVGYNMRITKAISPTTIPYAKETIPARTLITSKMIGKIRVSSDYTAVADNLIQSSEEVIGKYSTYRTAIPAGSLFYRELVVSAEEMPDAAFANIEDGYTIFSLSVDQEKTYDNSVAAGDYIDLYLKAADGKNGEDGKTEEQDLAIFGLFIQSIRVLAVKDGNGNNIVKHGYANGDPAELLFAVDEENYLLLYRAHLLGINILPVLHNKKYTEDAGETKVTSEELRNYISEKVYEVK